MKLDDDSRFDSREDLILSTILAGKEFFLEPNKFPYDTPQGIEHWTLWSRSYLSEERIEALVEDALVFHPVLSQMQITSWGFDDNAGARSFDIEHVHVYFQTLRDEDRSGAKVVELSQVMAVTSRHLERGHAA